MSDQRIIDMLRAGYGAEDIALQKGLPVEDVRAFIRSLRQRRELENIYPQTARTTAPKETPQ